ncbi:DUF4278 domain-containing protein [Leptolyngbya iicbica]|uniref:DUF4278 domain-containing protein n=2 Tax=Cyanophyceae TaxID=3028117 RepID=A0A4Q7E5M7_9CYAN|nr:DUF4278 domain-containing protein [Leptolyngbya sp. LK]RZM77379.1 DUF4278 domain-containing protein [Leptolyngbya sp. LK]
MKLTYRGIQYDYNPPVVEMNNTAEVGKYRGVDIRFRSVKKNPVQQPTLDLVYRGVAYRTGETAVETTPVAAPVATVADAPATLADLELKARTLLMGHHRNVKRRQQAMMTRLAADVGLEGDVNQYWSRIQGKVHPSFWATYDRGGSAAS